MRRVNAIVDRAADAGAIDERARRERVDRERLNLVQNHECAHERWEFRHGANVCDECHDFLEVFLFECRQCHILSCRQCRYHRL